MMELIRKNVCMLLALALVLTWLPMLPATAYAEELETFTVGECKQDVAIPQDKVSTRYTFTPAESGTYAFTGYVGTMTALNLSVSDGAQTISIYHGEIEAPFGNGTCVFDAEAGKTYTLAVVALNAFGEGTNYTTLRLDKAVAPTGVHLSDFSIDGSVGDEYDLAMRFDPLWSIPETYTWSVDDSSVAAIDSNGHLTLLANGHTTVRLTTASGLSAECDIDVVTVTAAAFDYETKTGYVGLKDSIDFSFEPYGASDAVTITSSDPSVVKVTGNVARDYWYMEYLAQGTVTLTLTTDGGLTDTCTVNVVAEMETIVLDEAVKVTVQPGDEICFAFTVPETFEYCIYTEEEAGAVGIRDYGSYDLNGCIKYDLTQGDEKQVVIWNQGSKAQTYTLCVKKTVPVERVEITGRTALDVGGRTTLTAKTYPIWSGYPDWAWTCGDNSAVTFSSSGRLGYVTAVANGTADITVMTASGATDTVTVTVGPDFYEEIFCGDSKILTLDNQEEMRYKFTPEADGEYVFYMPYGEFVWNPEDESGYSKDFQLSILLDGVDIGEWVNSDGYTGVYCEMTAGSTYTLCAANQWAAEVEITGTVTLEKMLPPEAITITSERDILFVGEYIFLTCKPDEGIPFITEDATWSVSDESVLSLDYTGPDGAEFIANAVGRATVTATLENGVSASYEVVVSEYKYYDIISGDGDVVVGGTDHTLSVHIDAPFEKFSWYVSVDGIRVPSQNYTATEGSTVITLDPEYLAKLEPGGHVLIARFIDGEAGADFVVQEKPEYIPGDTNGDGKLNGKDGVLLAQYLAEWDVTINMEAADVNGDGKVNGKDGILLAQYLAEWDVVLG